MLLVRLMRMKTINDKKLKDMDISEELLTKLNANNIFTIKDVWQLSRIDLKNMGLNNVEIKSIVIKLELLGLDLNKKIY